MNRSGIESLHSLENPDKASPGKHLGKRVGVVLLAVAVFICGMFVLNDVLREKWSYNRNASQQIVQGYYREAPQSLDVLCLGASTVRNGISGLEMFHDYGFTTYSRGTSVQWSMLSYYLLQETLEKQDIKAVVMDATSFSNLVSEQAPEMMAGKIHEAIDYMPWSKYKWEMVQEVLKVNPSVTLLDFVLPLYAYHDRWEKIGEYDFIYRKWQDEYFYKGQYPTLRTVAATYADDYMTEDAVRDGEDGFCLDGMLTDYCTKAIELCKSRGIEFVLVKMPSAGWNVNRHEMIEEYARQQGVTFIDYCDLDLQDRIGFDEKTDYADSGNHLNITGASKVSMHLGDYLASVCDFRDKRQDPAYGSWNQDYEKYASLLADAELARENNAIGFLRKLGNPNYITMISVMDDVSRHYNGNVASAFAELGIDVPFADTPYLSYLAVLDNGTAIYQAVDEDPGDDDHRLTCSMEHEGHTIQISSLASPLKDNEASILFDGEELCPSKAGFNFVVYDKMTGQIAATKSFNTGRNGKNYTPPDPLASYTSDPLAYLGQLSNEDYIAVLGVSAEGSRYMPGVVNDQLAQMGLIPLDKEFDRPYIAVLDGGRVVYNAYGEPGTELNYAGRVDGLDVAVVSSTSADDAHLYVSVGGETDNWTKKQAGLCVDAYSKSEGRILSSNRYSWGDNYMAAEKVNGTTNVLELLTVARNAGYDALCVYAPGNTAQALPGDVAQALREAGLDLLEDGCYVGLLRADGSVEAQSDPEAALLEAELDGMKVALTAGGEACGASFGGVEYAAKAGELSLYLYDPESRAVLTQARYAPPQPVEPANLSAVRADPLAYLAQIVNEDYIAVLGVSVEGSRYMPGVVNDQLVQMGLIPLDKEFNRPYIAVLDGGRVVYNAYGEPGTELDHAGRVAGLEIAVVSSASADDAHLYVCIDGKTENVTKRQVGLCVEIYSKSEGRYVSTNRYDWSNNHLSAEKVNGTTNALELLSVARNAGYDALCVYAPGDPAETLPEAAVKALREASLGLSEGGCYVGLLHADGSVEEQSDPEKALLEAELAGMPVALTAGGEASGASFGGVDYAAKAGELNLYLYDLVNRAVLTQVRYAAQAPAEP